MRRNDESWPYPPSEDQPSWPASGQNADWSFPEGEEQPNWPSEGDFPSWPAGGHQPSWPAANQQPGRPYPSAQDQPGWPDAQDQPGWPAAEVQPNWPPEDDFPGRAADGSDAGGQLGEDHPSRSAGNDIRSTRARGGSALPRRRTLEEPHQDRRTPAPRSAPAGRAQVPESGAPDWIPRRSGPQTHIAAPQAYPGAVNSGGSNALLAENPPTGHRPANGEPAWLAERLLSDADQEAAAIKQQALDVADAIRQAAERKAEQIRRQAAYRAGQVREAEWEAEQIRRQAAYRVGRIREAAARDAGELHAAAIRLSAELGRVAEYVTGSLTIPAIPAAGSQRQAAEDHAAPALPGAGPRNRPHRQAGPSYDSSAMPAPEPQVLPADRSPATIRTTTAPRCPPPRHPPDHLPGPEAGPIPAAGQRAEPLSGQPPSGSPPGTVQV